MSDVSAFAHRILDLRHKYLYVTIKVSFKLIKFQIAVLNNQSELVWILIQLKNKFKN